MQETEKVRREFSETEKVRREFSESEKVAAIVFRDREKAARSA